jgi:hypothetical protein
MDRRRAGAQEVEVEGSRPCCGFGSGGVGVDLERGSRKRERWMVGCCWTKLREANAKKALMSIESKPVGWAALGWA